MKKFLVTWYENKTTAYGKEATVRTNTVTAIDAKTATAAFCREFGNLKTITIMSLQEIGPNGEAIGEPIVPED